MPTITEQIILRAWKMRAQPDEIQFMARMPDGQEKRLRMDTTNVLYPVLTAHLEALGYTGPGDAEE